MANHQFNYIITGAASGIGRSTAKKLALTGASLFLIDKNISKLEMLHQELVSLHKNQHFFMEQCDVSQLDSCQKSYLNAKNKLHSLHGLVNCAGILGEVQPFQSENAQNLHALLSVNVFGSWHMTQLLLTDAIQNALWRPCSIVNLASIAGINAAPGLLFYGMTKAAIIQMSKTLAVEVAKYSIRVNTVCPGFTETPMLEEVHEKSPMLKRFSRERTPLRRFATSDEVASSIAWLLSEEASFITGQEIIVDGGYCSQ